MERVSVIVPVYNVALYLEKCIESILAQSYKKIEIILVDDGSKDGSGDICDKYSFLDDRISVFHRSNSGVSAARNFGLRHAHGDWIFFVDADDWIHPKTVELAMKYSDKLCDICFIGLDETEDESVQPHLKLKKSNIMKIRKRDFQKVQLQVFNRDRKYIWDVNKIKVSSACRFYRRELITKHNLRFPETLLTGEDGMFNLYAYRYARQGIAIDLPLYYYRQHTESVTKKYNPEIEKAFHKLHMEYDKFIRSDDHPGQWKEAMDERLIWSLGFCCILIYCHPDNKNSYVMRRKEFFHTLYKEYGEAVKRVKLKNFGLEKKVLFWAIKKKSFLLVSILCYLSDKKRKCLK